jgi:hypothetical protein
MDGCILTILNKDNKREKLNDSQFGDIDIGPILAQKKIFKSPTVRQKNLTL